MYPGLPLFGLNTPIVPGLVLPLHIFEPRYLQLVEDLLTEPDEQAREFGLVSVREGRDPSTQGLEAIYPVGTSVLLQQVERLADGRLDVVTMGHRRFQVHAVDTSAPLLRGEVEWLAEVTGPDDEAAAQRCGQAFLGYRAALSGQVGGPGDVVEIAEPSTAAADALPTDPTVLSYLVTAAMVLPVDERVGLVRAATTTDRLLAATHLLRRETAIIRAVSCVPALELPGPEPSVN